MRKNFYVKPEDEHLFDQISNENLSGLIVSLLRNYLNGEPIKPKTKKIKITITIKGEQTNANPEP